MPTASDRQRNLMAKWFGDPIAEAGPIQFLESHGFVLLRNWHWQKPTPSYTVSSYEMECISFLFHEWDFGGLEQEGIAP